jgi:hypothetical protein
MTEIPIPIRTKINNRIAHLIIPENMRNLKISDEGFPVPWFIGYVNGKPDFRTMDGEKLAIAVRRKLCWSCGRPMGRYLTFAIGPMCMVTRTISEPPSHLSCLEYSVRACPFLSQPRMKRNDKDLPEGHMAGIAIMRNPGVVALWTTFSYQLLKGPLFRLGPPEHIEFYAEGRPARSAEIIASMESGLPLLRREAEDDDGALVEIEKLYAAALKLLPKE